MDDTDSPESPLVGQNIDTRRRRKTRRIAGASVAGILVLTAILGITIGVSVNSSSSNSETIVQVSAQSLNDRPLSYLEQAKEILREVPLIDGHNDLPWRLQLNTDGQLSRADLSGNLSKQFGQYVQTDIPLIRHGQLGGQFWSVFTMCNTQYRDGVQKAVELIDLVKRFTNKYSDVFKFVTNADEIIPAHKGNRLASLIGVEGGHMMGNSLSVLRMLYDMGARYMTLTWNCNTPWADYNQPEKDKATLMKGGISKWGEIVVKEMNRIGMMVDLAHVSHDTMRDVIRVSRAPVIFSHSSAYGVCPHPRNVPDDVLASMRKNNGIVMVNFSNQFINCTASNRLVSDRRTASLSQVADHIEYLRDRIGVSRIGLGSDYNGGASSYNSFPTGLENTSKYPHLIGELLRRGWSAGDLKQLAGLNLIRVFQQVERIRDMSKRLAPYEEPLGIDQIPARSCITYPWST